MLKHKYLKNHIMGNTSCPICLRDRNDAVYYVTINHKCICELCLYRLEKEDPDFALGFESSLEDPKAFEKLKECIKIAQETWHKYNPTYSLAS